MICWKKWCWEGRTQRFCICFLPIGKWNYCGFMWGEKRSGCLIQTRRVRENLAKGTDFGPQGREIVSQGVALQSWSAPMSHLKTCRWAMRGASMCARGVDQVPGAVMAIRWLQLIFGFAVGLPCPAQTSSPAFCPLLAAVGTGSLSFLCKLSSSQFDTNTHTPVL